ncbi:MAG TPA: DUF4349 domain-containing protein [Spirochaetota bacterium]|nr:DUF4349 domain-containing protein [Spirochaetota bacterium]HQP48551.1 DUF4349 domain-containing protein [Spirochaetota bacterium]
MRNTKNAIVLMSVFCFSMLVFSSCSKGDEPQEAQRFRSEAPAPAGNERMTSTRVAQDATPSASEDTPALQESSDIETDDRAAGGFSLSRIQPLLKMPFTEAKDRLLEYNVNLNYKCDNFKKARLVILDVASRYGFIRSGYTDIYRDSNMTVHVSVQAAHLYRFLRELDSIGELFKEHINVNDLTEQLVLAQRQSRREQVRIERKNRAMTGLSAQSKNWTAIDQSLERSEDASDRAEHSKWQIADRVAWAKITINIEPTGEIRIPPYKKALYWLVETALETVYAVIYLIPLLVVVFLIWWQRGRIAGIFKGQKIKKNKDE